MDSVILFCSETDKARAAELAPRIMEASSLALVGVGECNLKDCAKGASVFQGDQSVWSSLCAAAQNSKTPQITLILVGSGISLDCMSKMCLSKLQNERVIGTFSVADGLEEITSAHFSASILPSYLTHSQPLPLVGIKIKKDFLLSQDLPEVQTPEGIIYSLLISAIGEFHTVESDIAHLQLSPVKLESLVPSQSERAGLLRQAVNQINIEELFPNHPWELAQTEAAASCYQKLSAHFIALKDYASAEECIALSQSFEDSPRSLALRGIVAMLKGEELEAVANMVSSLQEYERFKKETTHTMLKIDQSAENLEDINAALQSGLEALNARKNSIAASHFATALFKFDSFFQESGLAMPQ